MPGTTIKILNSAGTEILQKAGLLESAMKLYISVWDEGLYIVEIRDETNSRTGKKFVVL